MSDTQVPEKFKLLVEQIEKMSVLDLSEFVKILEEKFGVSSVPTMLAPAAGGAGAAGAQAEAQEEKATFTVELTEAGGNKIAVIKVVRELTGLGLADSKAIVDSAPKTVKEGVERGAAEEMKKKLEEAGGKVTLK